MQSIPLPSLNLTHRPAVFLHSHFALRFYHVIYLKSSVHQYYSYTSLPFSLQPSIHTPEKRRESRQHRSREMLSFQQGDSTGKGGGREVQEKAAADVFHGETASRGSNISAVDQRPSTAKKKKKRSLPGTPDPSAEVVALSPGTLMATNRFTCEICNKGFQRDQNLQLHRRGHNLPWKLRQRAAGVEARKRVYVCPEPSCVHHNPARALGDLTGIKKHYCRKHGEKKWRCDRCSKRYAVHSDWKAHMKTCGTKEYRCDCGSIFSRRDSFVTHRAFCDALTVESHKLLHQNDQTALVLPPQPQPPPLPPHHHHLPTTNPQPSTTTPFPHSNSTLEPFPSYPNPQLLPTTIPLQLGEGSGGGSSTYTSATALLQKAAQMGATARFDVDTLGGQHHLYGGGSQMAGSDVESVMWAQGGGDVMTVDFMGVAEGVQQKRRMQQGLLPLHPFDM